MPSAAEKLPCRGWSFGRAETPAEVAAVIREARKHVKASQIFPSTNCGMMPLERGNRYASLSLGERRSG